MCGWMEVVLFVILAAIGFLTLVTMGALALITIVELVKLLICGEPDYRKFEAV